MEEQKELERLENYRKQIIEEERRRLLREHASKLLGYLPKVTFLFHLKLILLFTVAYIYNYIPFS